MTSPRVPFLWQQPLGGKIIDKNPSSNSDQISGEHRTAGRGIQPRNQYVLYQFNVALCPLGLCWAPRGAEEHWVHTAINQGQGRAEPRGEDSPWELEAPVDQRSYPLAEEAPSPLVTSQPHQVSPPGRVSIANWFLSALRTSPGGDLSSGTKKSLLCREDQVSP